MRIAGMVSMRMDEVEERRLAVLPGTSTETCGRCGEKVAVSPAMYKMLNREGPRIWCWECLWEVHPEGVNFTATREMMLEALVMDRLNRGTREGGPIH